MRKIKYYMFAVLLSVVCIGSVDAAALKMSASTTNAVVGNTVTVTVTASGAAGWEYCLNYDSSVFKLTSATSDTGGACVRTGSTLIGHSKVSFKLKVIKSGSSSFTLRDAVMYGDDGNSVTSTKGSVKITARTRAEIEASYSDNANLKSLGVEGFDMTPEFDKDTLEYTLEVENNVTSVNIVGSKAESHASVDGTGTIELSEGLNKVSIVVTAQKGNRKTYVINITRKELDPINVNVNGETLTVVRKAESLEVPTYYEATTANIEGEEVPALYNEISKYTLVGLKDEDGNIKLYRYIEKKDAVSFEKYYQFSVEALSFIPVSAKEKIDGFDTKKTIKINDEKVEVYYADDNNDFVLIYGLNMLSGNTAWYQFDIKENTFQRYNDVGLSDLQEKNFMYFVVMCIIGAVLVLSLLVMFILGVNNSKMKKKNQKMLMMLEELNNRVKSSNIKKDETIDTPVKTTRKRKVKKEN